MGYIKSITIENFKSFKGVTTIEPFDRWNSVVGPNGSGIHSFLFISIGKSNFFEAIAFVLGSTGNRLKGASYKDLIYKNEANESVQQMASVSLVYQLEENDMTPELTSDVIEFKRKVSSKNFTYQIDGRQCTKDEYTNTLRSLSITPSTCLIFQTQVNELSTKSDTELAKLFEDISGSIAYKNEILEMKKEIEKLKEVKQEIFKVQLDINSRKRLASSQCNEYEKHTTCKKQLSDLEIEMNLHKIQYYHNCIIRNETELSELEKKKIDDEEKKNEIEEEIKRIKIETAKYKGDLSKKQQELSLSNKDNNDDRIRTISSNIQSIDKTINKLENEKNKKSEKLVKLLENRNNVCEEIENNQKERDETNKKINELINQSNNSNTSDTFIELNRKYNDEVADYVRSQRILNTQKNSILLSIDNFQNNIGIIETDILKLKDDITEDENKKINLGQQQTEINKENIEIRKDIISLQKELEKSEKAKEYLQKQNSVKTEEIFKLTSQITQNRHENDLFDAKTKLTQKYSDKIIGTFSSLVKINNDEYTEAITTAFGKYSNSIVIYKQEDADEMIKYLTNHRLPPITFIPLDKIQFTEVTDSDRNNFRNYNNNFYFAVDLITIDRDDCKNIGKYALSNTIICNTIQDARDFINKNNRLRYRFVSKDGMIMNKSRCLTGGSNAGNSNNYNNSKNNNNIEILLREREENEKKIKELLELCSSNGINSIKKQINAKEYEIKSNDTKLKEIINPDLKVTVSRISGNKVKLSNFENEKKKYKQQIKKYQNDIMLNDNQLKGIEEKMNEIHSRIFHNLSQSTDNNNSTNEAIVLLQQKVNSYERDRNKLDGIISDLNQSLNIFNKDIESCTNEIETFENIINEKKKNLETNKLELDEIMKKGIEISVEDIKTEIKEIQSKLEDYNNEREGLKSELSNLKSELTSTLQLINQNKNIIQLMKSNIHNVFDICRNNGIILPTNNNNNNNTNDDNLMSESQDIYSQATQSTIEERILKDNQLVENIDFSSIRKSTSSIEIDDDAIFKRNIEDYENRIEKLKQALKKSEPNGQAVEDLKQCKLELAQNLKETKELQDKMDEMRKELNEIKEKRNKKFNELFEIVESNINQIYTELSVSGTAFLTNISNDDDDIDKKIKYSVTPANKRNRELNNLSGGEKAIASLALLFAIHNYQKTPFIVMDEIDAELDNRNVMNIQKYILKHKDDIQFITVSLKDILFSESDSLIGVYKKESKSNVLSLDLSHYN